MTDYDTYVERYAKDRNITKKEAETHALVIAYKKYLEEVNNAKPL